MTLEIRQAKRRDLSGDLLQVDGAAAIDGYTTIRPDGPWVFLAIRNAEVDDAGEPVAAASGPPVLGMTGRIEDVGHLLVGLLNAYSQLTGVPIEEWISVAAVQPTVLDHVPPDEMEFDDLDVEDDESGAVS